MSALDTDCPVDQWGWAGDVDYSARLSGAWLFDRATAPASVRTYRFPADFTDWQQTALALLIDAAAKCETIRLPTPQHLTDPTERSVLVQAQRQQAEVCFLATESPTTIAGRSLVWVKRDLFDGNLSLFALRCATCCDENPQTAYFYGLADALEPTMLTDQSATKLLRLIAALDERAALAYRLDPHQIVDCHVLWWRRQARALTLAATDHIDVRFVDQQNNETERHCFSRAVLCCLAYFRMILRRHPDVTVLTIHEDGFRARHILLWLEAKLLTQLGNTDAENEELRAQLYEEVRSGPTLYVLSADASANGGSVIDQVLLCDGPMALDRAWHFLGLGCSLEQA